MRLIDADTLSELLVKTYEKAPTENALLFVALLLKNSEQVPTVAVNCKDCDGYEAGYSAGLKDAERPQGEYVDISKFEKIWRAIANGIPYEPKGDLISREALKKCARIVFDKDLGRLRVVDVSDIDNAPTVSPYKAIHDELHKGEEE